MCGIVGIVSQKDMDLRSALERATGVMHHRGPDAQRVWVAESGPMAGRVALGHARLSIIDLSTGDQPLTNEDGTVHAVVNGELYDFERIRGELSARGHKFKTTSDSEILLHLYEEHGVDCVDHLRGEFAFLLWDERRELLLAGRDRFGIKPLFYAERDGALFLGSEVKALLKAGVPAAWDVEAFHQMISVGTTFPDRSLFDGVRQLPAGHVLLARRGQVSVRPYWDFNYPKERDIDRKISTGEHIERFRALLEESVRLRLRADVPVACYLSGGLDSCAVLGLASRHVSTPVHAFTLSFDHADYDEASFARESAALTGARFDPIPIRHADLAEAFGDAVWNAETLFTNAHGVGKFLLSRAVRDAGFRVVLTGEGSDEILGGYAPFRRDLLRENRAGLGDAEVRAKLQALADKNKVSAGTLLRQDLDEVEGLEAIRDRLGYVPSFMESFGALRTLVEKLVPADRLAPFERHDVRADLLACFDVRGQLSGRERLSQSMYLWSKTALQNYLLSVLGDRMEMAHSVEGRVPFLDHVLVEAVVRMPSDVKIREQTEKFVLREAVKDVIPKSVYERQKHPFMAPPSTLKPDEPLSQLVQSTLRGPLLDRVPFFDRAKVVAFLDHIPQLETAKRIAVEPFLMQLTSACVLADRYGLN